MPQAKRVMPQAKCVMPQAKCVMPHPKRVMTHPSLLGLFEGALHIPFEGFIEYLEFNKAKTDEFDEVLDNIAFMYSILMIIFHRNSG